MAIVTELLVPAEEVALGHAIRRADDRRFDAIATVARDRDRTLPLLRADGAADAAFDAALTADPSVRRARRLTDGGDGHVYRVEWNASVDDAFAALTGGGGTVLDAAAGDGRWKLRLLFPDRKALSNAYRNSRTRGLSVEVTRLFELQGGECGRLGLTEHQRELLVAAARDGYYDVPRGITLSELAERFRISHQSFSETLRRGQKNLIVSTLFSQPEM